MISRKSAKLIGLIYTIHFQPPMNLGLRTSNKILYDFLYELDYEAWFLNIVVNWMKANLSLENGIMKIHTGESIVSATKDWKWEKRRELGQSLLKKLATDIIHLYENLPMRIYPINPSATDRNKEMFQSINERVQYPFNVVETLKKQLEIDGYIYRDGILYFSESSVIKEQEEQSILELLIDQLPLNDKPIIINHLKLSEEHYLNGKWGDSISNSRNFLEAILEKIAHYIHNKKNLITKIPNRPVLVRDFLEQQGFIDTSEKDAISKVYGLISNTGSHPNIAEQDEARLMRHLALTFSQYILLTFETYIKNNP